jgi:hypothetical protein
MDEWLILANLHKAHFRGWRKFESALIAAAAFQPGEQWCCEYDDTTVAGLPHFTNRPPKNLGMTRVGFTPWNYNCAAADVRCYIWSVKGAVKKGANRLCTCLFHLWKAQKEGTDDHRFARHVSCIADNYSENKNNTDLAFASFIVAKGWFDNIDMVFGPVGHTHGGQDRDHEVLNNKVLGHSVGTLGQLASLFPQAWQNERKAPDNYVQDVVYNWDKFFQGHIDAIGGCWTHELNEQSVRAFRICRGTNGNVEVRWKVDPADQTPWLGLDGKGGSPGHVVLKSMPHGVPDVVLPFYKNVLKEKKHRSAFKHTKIRAAMRDAGILDAHAWLMRVADTGRVPIAKWLEAERP